MDPSRRQQCTINTKLSHIAQQVLLDIYHVYYFFWVSDISALLQEFIRDHGACKSAEISEP